MKWFPWKVERKNSTESDKAIEKIREVLFPKSRVRITKDNEGNQVKYQLDYSIDTNLDVVLSDLQTGYNDENVHRTLSSMIDRLTEVRKILEVRDVAYPDTDYIVVENAPDKISDIIPNEGIDT